jgi:hypothetical protein
MFRCITEITIKQNSEGRNKSLFFDFVNEFEASDTWVDLTNQATVKFPKNIYVRDENGKLFPLGGDNKSIGGFSNETPLFLKGDLISINFGYWYFDKLGNEKRELPQEPIFKGYITEVISKKPIELKCEDNMWKLKQISAPNKLFPQKSYTWEAILKELLTGTGFTVNALTSTRIGDFRTQNETVAQVIERVRKDFHLEAYFRGNELRCGAKVYVDSDNIVNGVEVANTFVFQENIISDDLAYKRKDDTILSAVCYSVNKFELNTTTKTGKTKTKNERLEILVYWDKKLNEFKFQKKEKGKEYPQNVEGERRSLYFWDINNVNDLFAKGVDELKKFYYTGFKGKFTTFAIPYIRQGNNIYIKDNVLPERNGKYKVKGVNYSGGTSGHRQEIILDYKIS